MSPKPSRSRVVKYPRFTGSLPTRPLYVYLPPGYDEDPDRHYPVLYMHDGQNLFDAYLDDTYTGVSWGADSAADHLITTGEIQSIVIVGVGHGEHMRIAEYLPPYLTLRRRIQGTHRIRLVPGQADRVAAYYADEIAPFIQTHFRVREDREHRGTCGSSLGGLMSAYLAWDHPEFARHHAVVSPSFWLTYNQEGGLEMLERMAAVQPPDVRIWLDSGTQDRNGEGDDGRALTAQARDVLTEIGFRDGENFRYYLADGADHSEGAWAERFPEILKFLFPA